MANGAIVVKGVVRGTTIELERELDLPDGEQVTVAIQPSHQPGLPPGEGLRQAFGAWAEDAEELDKFLESNRQQRQRDSRELRQ